MHLSLKGSLDRQPLTDRLGDRLLAEYGGAAAAYSLRALNGNGDSVVRVRRASDNDEEDFTAEQIELGEMVNWVNSQTVPPLDIGVETSGGRIPVPEGGTSIGIPAAAYSLRNLSTTYTGNVVDVRRSSGGTESFTAAEVADGTLTDWVLAPVSSFIGNKMYFDRVNDYINLDYFISYTGDFTLTFSFIPDTLDGTIQPVVGNGNIDYIGVAQINGSDRIYVSTLAGSTQFIVLDSNFTEKAVNDVIISRSGSTITFTVNGDVQSTTLTYSTTIPISRIGARGIGVALLKGIITELDFGNGTTFDGTIADGNTIGTVNGSPELFTGQGFDGFVTQWYDQSGNDNHATQGTAASQPTIVEGGSLVTKLGQPSMDFTTGSTMLLSDSFSITETESAVFAIWQPAQDSATTVQSRNRTLFGNASSQIYIGTPNADSQMSFKRFDAVKSFTLGLANLNTPNLHAFVGTTAGADYYFNGSSIYSDTATGTNSIRNHLRIGAKQNLATHDTEGYISELIIYDSDQSANRTAIEANIGETYGITGIPAYDNTVDGFVETWYDQSGNGNDATQSVAGSQPKIVDAGVLVSGGLDFDGVDDLLELSGSGLDIFKDVGYAQVFAVAKSSETGTGSGRLILAGTDNPLAARYVLSDSPTVSASYRIAGRRLDSDSLQTVTSNSPHGNLEKILTGFLNYNDSEAYLYQNGTNVATELNFQSDGNSSNTSSSLVEFGSNGFDGTIREIIIYPSDQSANRVAIETNINDHYDIYP
jgi:hypothetical protein